MHDGLGHRVARELEAAVRSRTEIRVPYRKITSKRELVEATAYARPYLWSCSTEALRTFRRGNKYLRE